MIRENYSLQKHNTFGIDVKADCYVSVTTLFELKSLIEKDFFSKYGGEMLVLGGGSNLLFTQDYHGVVIHPEIDGFEISDQPDGSVRVKAGAGIVWDHLVARTIESGLSGMENLSLIPGMVGASPIQNIGAYGVEVSSLIDKVNLLHIESGKESSLKSDECNFGYRNSIFKQELKGKIIITSVEFVLSRSFTPLLDYGDIRKIVEEKNEITPASVREAVISIRESKLPDPAKLGNAGSFFRNPVITSEKYNKLKAIHADIPGYQSEKGYVKVPAGWLIERGGWKGFRSGNVGVHEMQALVLVNHGFATGKEVSDLADAIRSDIKTKYDVDLDCEVNII